MGEMDDAFTFKFNSIVRALGGLSVKEVLERAKGQGPGPALLQACICQHPALN